MGQENNPETDSKTNLWNDLEDRLNCWRVVGLLSDTQVYRLLTDFAEAHKPK
jgi:hypothetical protein